MSGTESMARIGLVLCAVIAAIAYYAEWRSGAGQMLFGIALLFLTVGAVTK